MTVNTQEHNDSIRLLSLTLLCDWIKQTWNNLSESDQTALRLHLFQLINSDIGLSGLKAIRTKLALLITIIAERSYPQLWDSFLSDMVGLWVSSPMQRQEIVIISLENLLIDCTDVDFNNQLPSTRRSDILGAIKSNLTPLLVTSFNFQEHCLSILRSSTDLIGKLCSLALINANIRLLQPIITFIKPDDVCRPPHDFGVGVISMLNIRDIQLEAVNLLHTISQHKLSIELFARIIESIISFRISELPVELDDSLIFQRTYAEAVYSILSLNVKEAMSPSFVSTSGAPEALNKYFTLMAELLSQPSRRLISDVANDWIKVQEYI